MLKPVTILSLFCLAFCGATVLPNTVHASQEAPAYKTYNFQVRNYSSHPVSGIAIRGFQRGSEKIHQLRNFSKDDPVWVLNKSYKSAIPKRGCINLSIDTRIDYTDGYVMRIYYADSNTYVDRKIQFDDNLTSFNIHDGWYENIEYLPNSEKH